MTHLIFVVEGLLIAQVNPSYFGDVVVEHRTVEGKGEVARAIERDRKKRKTSK